MIRLECQLKRGKLKSLGLCKLQYVWRRYDELPGIYSRLVKDTLFYAPVGDSGVLAASQLESEMLAYKGRCGRNWYSHYLQDAGLSHLRSLAGPEALFDTLTRVTGSQGKDSSSQRRLSRFKRDINDKTLQIDSLRVANSSSRTLGALYCELESKLTV